MKICIQIHISKCIFSENAQFLKVFYLQRHILTALLYLQVSVCVDRWTERQIIMKASSSTLDKFVLDPARKHLWQNSGSINTNTFICDLFPLWDIKLCMWYHGHMMKKKRK